MASNEEFESMLKFVQTLTYYDKERILKLFRYFNKHKDDPEFMEVWDIMIETSHEED